MADPDEAYIAQTKAKINDLLEKLGWDLKSFTENKTPLDFVDCPNNKKHRIVKANVKEHLERCGLVPEGYGCDDTLFPESFPCHNYIQMTPELQNEIFQKKCSTGAGSIRPLRPVPQSSNRLLSDFSREERLAIYEFVREQTSSTAEIPVSDLIVSEKKEEKKELSEIEKAILERDARRRRTTYRNKVHLNNKSHTEIMREVIASQMEDMINTKGADQCTSQSGPKEHGRSSSERERNSEKRKKRKKDRSPEKRHKRHKESHHKKKKKDRKR